MCVIDEEFIFQYVGLKLQVKVKYEIMVEKDIEVIIQECEIYMLIDEGKYSILNLVSLVFIVIVNWNKIDFEVRIKFRVDLYVKEFLEFDFVVKKYENIVKEIEKFYKRVIFSIKRIEDEFVDINFFSDKDIELWIYLIEIGIILFFIWVFVIGFGLGFIVVIIVGGVFVVLFYFCWILKIIKDIDDEYKKCKNIVLIVICIDF